MTSFVITASAVIVAVIAIPSSPKAEINQVQVFKNQVVYQVEVTDADNAIDIDTLEIVLENQFEHYRMPLELGINVGEFSNLNDGTTYQMSVMGSKGFGQERLATQEIVTQPNSGGAITNYTLIEGIDQFDLQFEIQTVLFDELDEYMDVQLYYGVIQMGWDVPFDYYNETVLDGQSTILLDNLFAMNGRIHVYMEATLYTSDTIILDEIYINIPIFIEESYYLTQVTGSSIVLSIYPDFSLLEDATYEFKLTKDGYPMETQTFDQSTFEESYMHYDYEVVFDGLKYDTLYEVALSITYTNPYTLATETKTFDPLEIRTLSSYTYQIDVQEFNDYFEVSLTLNDPKHNFQLSYYDLYEIYDDYNVYISAGQFGFTPAGDSKSVTFTIDKSANIPFIVEIGVLNETTSYYYEIIYVIMTLE